MGANAQTSVPAFTSGQVLTAAQVTQINTGIPVFASSTERDAAFGGTGEKTLAEGQMAYLEDTDETQYYDGSSWAAVGGGGALVFISRTTIGSGVSSVTVSGAFSTDYDNYRIFISGGAASGDVELQLELGATTSGYYYQLIYGSWNNTVAGQGSTTASEYRFAGAGSSDSLFACIDIQSPFLSEETFMESSYIRDTTGAVCRGLLPNTTSYTAFNIKPASGTLTGGHIDVYGYAKA